MCLTLDIENNYFLEIAKQSLPYNMELYLFSPQGISPMNEIVDGFYFNKKNLEWEKEAFDIPAFIYDRTYYQSDLQSRQGKAVVQWLKNQKSIRFWDMGFPTNGRYMKNFRTVLFHLTFLKLTWCQTKISY